MLVRNWLDELKQKMSVSSNRHQRRTRRVRSSAGRSLRMESLEDRSLLSMTSVASVPIDTVSASADFNNDGTPDLAAVGYGSDSVVIALGNGNGSFGAPQTTGSLPPTAANVAVGDFNSDGLLDLATGHYEYYGTGDHDVSILFGNGDGTFDPAIPLDISEYGPSWGVASGSVDADGRPDLVVVEADVPGGFGEPFVHVLRGDGLGSFMLASTSGPIRNYGSRVDVGMPVVADFNGDGKADVAVPAGTAGKDFVKVFLGNGDGTLQPPSDITTY